MPISPDFVRTTHVARASSSLIKSEVRRLFILSAIASPSLYEFYAVIGEHALEFRSVVAEKRFYEQRGKPVIIEIDDRPSAEFRHEGASLCPARRCRAGRATQRDWLD